MLRKLLSSIVERSEDKSKEDEVIERGFFIFENAEDRNLVPYELKKGDDFMKERDKAAAKLEGDR